MNSTSAPFFADGLDALSRPSADRSFFGAAGGRPIAILGVPLDHVTLAEAIARIDAMVASRRPHYVTTARTDFVIKAQRDGELRRVLVDADLVLCTSRLLVSASRWLGNALPERIAGGDLVREILRNAARKGYRLFYLGQESTAAEVAAAELLRHYPSLHLVGSYSLREDSDFAEGEEISRRVRSANPDILLVSTRCPEQEKWIAQRHRRLGIPVTMAVETAMDALTAAETAAPVTMARSCRWARQWPPQGAIDRRWTRNFTFVGMLARQAWRHLFARDPAAAAVAFSCDLPEWCRIEAGTHLTRRALDREPAFWQRAHEIRKHCFFDVSNLRVVDGTGVALLLRWRKHLLANGRQLVLLTPSPALQRMLAAMKLADHFLVAGDLAEAIRRAHSVGDKTTVQRDGAIRSLAWCGEIVNANVDDVWRMTSEHLTAFVAQQATLVIIDLARLRFIDSAGAALMLRLKKWTQQLRTELLFAHPPPHVRNVLRLTQVEQLLLEGGQ